jgi:hypothetical protein
VREVEFTINHQVHSLTREQVESAMDGIVPEAVRSHAVRIRGRLFPVKQVMALSSGIDRLDFTSAQARSVLQRLGFELARVG